MGYVLYVGFATHCRATVRTHLCLYKKKTGRYICKVSKTLSDQFLIKDGRDLPKAL
jgi:hypothetical protein